MTLTESKLTQLIDTARAWAETDPDPETAAGLRELIVRASQVHAGSGSTGGADAGGADAVQELADCFSGSLRFGTAGLRAALGPGPNRMNRVVVRRAAAGIAAFLREKGLNIAGSGTFQPRAVVGFDARRNSDIFAQETAAIFTAAGIQTFLLPSALPTPILAYAVRALDCDGGVMVTASHNPPQDNGYKVYLGGRVVEEAGAGVQIVAPYDAEIAAQIDAVGPVGDIELAPEGWTVLPETIEDEYVAAVAALARPERFGARGLKIVLTPLHGVGGRTALKVLNSAGFDDVTLVPEQADPDPVFPTVAFPNPEEPGALDLALRTAQETAADLVLANDPDADRVAVAAKDPHTGEWRMLHGDEVGALLGAHVVARLEGGADPAAAAGPAPVFANSIVSSRLLSRIAAAAGYRHAETLTGFKWISRVPGLVYGYEEALGYCVAPDLVRDKDGLSAALLIAEMAADAAARGTTLFDTLDDLALQHGLHSTDQLSVRVGSLAETDAMLNRLREDPPQSFAGSAVKTVVDLSPGSASLPATEGLLYLTQDRTRVIIRPSGTEPKLKCYLEVIRPVDSADRLAAARTEAREALDRVREDVGVALGL